MMARRNIVLLGKRGFRGDQASSQHIICQNYHVFSSSSTDRREDEECQRGLPKEIYLVSTGTRSLPSAQLEKLSSMNNNQSRFYVTSTKPKEKSGITIAMGLGAVAATAKAGQYVAQAYNQWKDSLPPEEEKENKSGSSQDEEGSKMNMNEKKSGEEMKKEEKKDAKNDDEKRENVFAKFFDLSVGSKFYEGGFEDKMTRREAALILGVRESSTPKRIKDAHRKLLILNHPDTGGSTYLAGKLNEAKELLLKGK